MEMQGRLGKWRRGSVLLEGLAAVVLLTLAACLNLEVVRRAWYEATLHHVAFLVARSRALGGGLDRSRREVRSHLARAFGDEKGASLNRGLRLDESLDEKGLVSRVHYRFPSLLRFPFRQPGGAGETKHHFEATRKCRFPF